MQLITEAIHVLQSYNTMARERRRGGIRMCGARAEEAR
jgi:hypothetical protein